MNALMRAYNAALDAVTTPRDTPKLFGDMDALEQRQEMAYYLMGDDGKLSRAEELMAAIGDWINPKELFSAWQAADTAKVWHLIDRAMAKGLGQSIDEENGL